jgi:hypothetical protein
MKPVVTSVTPVNHIIGADLQAQIDVVYTHNDTNDLWFRFDLIPGSHSPVEGTWEKVNKAGGSVRLTYKRSGVSSPGIPSNWQDATRISTQLVWGEGGHGAGALVKRYPNQFTTQQAVTAGTTGKLPHIVSAVPTPGSIPIGGPAQMLVTYNSDVPGYLRMDLKRQSGLTSKSWDPVIGWNEGRYQYIEAGQNKQITLVFADVPANWNPAQGIQACAAQIVWSASGTGAGGLLTGQEKMFWILAPGQGTTDIPPVMTKTTDTRKKDTTIIDDGDKTKDTTVFDDGDTTKATAGGLTQWLKDNWVIVALIGAFVLLVMPSRDKND